MIFRENKGITLIELMVSLVLFSIGVMGMITIIRRGTDMWGKFSKQTNVQQQARAALLEMSTLIRQSSGPVTLMSPGVGATSRTAVTFVSMNDGKQRQYFKTGSMLKRVVDTSTSTLIYSSLQEIYFVHESSYVLRIDSMTLTSGFATDKSSSTIRLSTRIFLRNL